MTLVSGIAVYVVVWWIVIFAVLPFGARPPETVEPGHATSAPERPRIALKMAITTVIAAVIWVILELIIVSGVISLREP